MFLRWKWQVFMLLGLFWGVFGDFWARNRHLFSFFGVASLLREGVGVLGITPHLLNVSVLRTPHLVRRTEQRLVLHFIGFQFCLQVEDIWAFRPL